MEDKDEWIRRRAYHLWQEEGQPHGKHDQHWERASREYQESEGQNAGSQTGSPTGPESGRLGIAPFGSVEPAVDRAAQAEGEARGEQPARKETEEKPSARNRKPASGSGRSAQKQ